eukprot:8517337-Alexandrium_andersonii.AAC.1
MDPGMPDDWVPPDWLHAEFGGEDAALGAVVLHAVAERGRVMADAEAFCDRYELDLRCRAYLLSRPVEVIDAVVH